jgi:hypothetical protein
MGYVFWYLGNGSQIEILPRSAGVFHREYIAGFRLEEISLTPHYLRKVGSLGPVWVF